MNTCEECGARMQYLGAGAIMCSKMYELALARYLAGDQRSVTHASLQDDPLIIKGQIAKVEDHSA